MTQLQVNQFSHGILNPGLGCLMSCLGSFLGLRCLTRARACAGRNRAIWLLIASVGIGGTGLWVTHVVAMLGYTIPGQQILLMLIVAMSPNEDEILADASLTQRLRAGASLAVRDSISSQRYELTQPDVFEAHVFGTEDRASPAAAHAPPCRQDTSRLPGPIYRCRFSSMRARKASTGGG